jgi:acyl-CoA reductase-like NAD-dependent aldehyde dehydrogenase
MAELFDDHLPDGVVNVVTGGVEPGAALTGHDGVDKLAFTGNSETGRAVLRSAAENVTSAMLELGGKNAALVFPDADIERAVEGCIEGSFYNTGEACSSAERLLVHEDVYDAFVDRFVTAAADVTVGAGTDPETDIGPLTSSAQLEKVRGYVETAREEGAEEVFAGETPDDPGLAGGYFVAPHVFADVTPEMRLFREEVFGPVVAVTPFGSEAEAVELANDVDFGLTAGVWTGDAERSMRVAGRLEAGTVYVNNFDRDALGAPFGGYKDSGMGRKLAFEETMREFTQPKTVRFSVGADAGPGTGSPEE